MKTFRNWRVVPMMVAALFVTSCSSDNDAVEQTLVPGESYTTDPVEIVVFSETDIEWFNPDTREVKFCMSEESLYQRLRNHWGELEFRYGEDGVLKVSCFVADWDSRVFTDLVLHYDVISDPQQSHFYLQDCYPLQFIADERVQANIRKNAGQWEAFVNYMSTVGKTAVDRGQN